MTRKSLQAMDNTIAPLADVEAPPQGKRSLRPVDIGADVQILETMSAPAKFKDANARKDTYAEAADAIGSVQHVALTWVTRQIRIATSDCDAPRRVVHLETQ